MARCCSAALRTEAAAGSPPAAIGPLVSLVPAGGAHLRALIGAMPERYPVLFDSVAAGALGRYSILAAYPEESLVLYGDGRLMRNGGRLSAGGFLDAFDASFKPLQIASVESPLPFTGGWVLYLGYEFAGELEPGLQLPATSADAPVAIALRVPAALVHEHATDRVYAVAEAGRPELLRGLSQAAALIAPDALSDAGASLKLQVEEEPEQRFRDQVLAAQAYIRAGDVYQANLSRRWSVRVAGPLSHAGLYARLRQANPAPFAAWAELPGHSILSSSPERLVRVRGGRIETRPIAGTRPRSGAPGRDRHETAAMRASPKERAEHVMLIDLERNDLGRVCKAGTVRVSEFMVTESYQHVHHIVSGVEGQLRPDTSPAAVLRALFPGGTITGCPKYRCMQIIGQLEGAPRGAYTGSLGYINRDGSMDFNILIRTLTLHGNEVEFRAGAGIVADSRWQRELTETRAKARGLLRAFGL
jgi:anthranilate synthase component I